MILRCARRCRNLNWICMLGLWLLSLMLRLGRNRWGDHRWSRRCWYRHRWSVLIICCHRWCWNHFRLRFRLYHCQWNERIIGMHARRELLSATTHLYSENRLYWDVFSWRASVNCPCQWTLCHIDCNRTVFRRCVNDDAKPNDLSKWNLWGTDHNGMVVRLWLPYYDCVDGTADYLSRGTICRILRTHMAVRQCDSDWNETGFCYFFLLLQQTDQQRPHLMWLIKCSFLVNGLLQIVHTCGLSPEWCFKWLVRCSFLVNVWKSDGEYWEWMYSENQSSMMVLRITKCLPCYKIRIYVAICLYGSFHGYLNVPYAWIFFDRICIDAAKYLQGNRTYLSE